MLSICYYNLSGIYYDEANLSKALESIEKAVFLDEKNNDQFQLGYSYSQLANIYSLLNNYSKAITYYEKSNKLAERLNYQKLWMENSFSLADLNKKIGNYKLALDYTDKANDLKDTIGGIDLEKKIEELNIKYKSDLKEEQNKRIREELLLKEDIIRTNKYRTWALIGLFIIIILLLLSVLLVFYFKNKSKEFEINLSKQQAIQQAEKNKHISTNIEILKDLIVEKNTIIKSLENQTKSNLIESDLKYKLIKKLSSEKNWAKFMFEFRLLHESFFENIKSKHPNLTSKDMRLLALMKLNLLDKEMSDLLNIELNSIRKAKSRLKVKLGLDADEEIHNIVI